MGITLLGSVLLALLHSSVAGAAASAQVKEKFGYLDFDRYPQIPSSGPQPNPSYMVDNQHNYFGTAPDTGNVTGATWACSGSFENYMTNLRAGNIKRCGFGNTASNQTLGQNATFTNSTTSAYNSTLLAKRSQPIERRDSRYWLTQLGPLGKQPLAGSGYKFYRDVVADYGADNTGGSDATEALNAAVQDGNRCGRDCGNTFVQGAIIYFPPGTYKICTPVIQLYYTQFIGDALNPPTIKGCDDFKGIALFDTDPYIPGGAGSEWYINQNQFFRQIRNFIFDLTEMPLSTAQGEAKDLVPTGIHWQVSQATSLQNLVFNMPEVTSGKNGTHVGVFMENGSGGFVSDLTFNGGAIGWRAGSQQYTARGLKFKNCAQAIQMVWSWGFNWQGVEISGGTIAFNISGKGGDTGQGIGSVSIIDSTISNVPVGILTTHQKNPPNIVLDNVAVSNVATMIAVDDGSTMLAGGSMTFDLWGTGKRYNGSVGTTQAGPISAPRKAASLLDNGKIFAKSRPQFENFPVSSFLVATQNGVSNDGTGDQTGAINSFLKSAISQGKVAYFPAGIYQVGGTVFVPTGSIIQGSSWSQIQGSGFYFSDMNNPQVMVRVGNKGEVGSVEIVEMLFTVKGPTAGAILMEWNVAGSSKGSAGMWDTHFRVGGGTGTDLDVKNCPKGGFNEACISASLLLRVTPQANGYFENVWVWTADHDNDMVMGNVPDTTANQISIYAARCLLIESQGPSWFIGTGSEHCVFYQYQLQNAKDIYLGHIQSETPYYQPNPVAPAPFGQVIGNFPGDPSFDDCKTDGCKAAWGLRVIDSQDVTLHSAGLYSFFQEYYQDCLETQDCQERILEVRGSTGVVIFNLFTVATVQIATGVNNGSVEADGNQSGFTTEVSVWLPIPGEDNIEVVYVGTEVWATPTARCPPPCILVLPPSVLPSGTVIDPGDYTTSFQYGNTGTTVIGTQTVTTFFTTTTTVTIDIPPITIKAGGGMPYSNVNVTGTATTFVASPSVSIPVIGVPLPDGKGGTTTRQASLPPWPQVTSGAGANTGGGGLGGPTITFHTPFVTTVTATKATVTTISFPTRVSSFSVTCPLVTEVPFSTPATTITLSCSSSTVIPYAFTCPATKVLTFLGPSAGVFTQDCTLVQVVPTTTPIGTGGGGGGGSNQGTTTTSTTTTPLPIWTTWPPGSIVPVTTSVDKPKPTDDGVVTPCKLWFFFICISWEDVQIQGWHWILPPGIYPPGPPPNIIQFPPGFTLKNPLPPWPPITIGQDHLMTYSQEGNCETSTISICATTTIFSQTVIGTSTKTTATATSSHCENVSGCGLKDDSTTKTQTTQDACTPTAARRSLETAGSSHSKRQTSDNGCAADAYVVPKDESNVGEIPQLLSGYAGKYTEFKSKSLGFTSHYYVPMLDRDTLAKLSASADVALAYYYEDYYNKVSTDINGDGALSNPIAIDNPGQLDPNDDEASVSKRGMDALDAVFDTNTTSGSHLSHLSKRAGAKWESSTWELSQVSLPPTMKWKSVIPNSGSWQPPLLHDSRAYLYRFDDDPNGLNQEIYLLDEAIIYTSHKEFSAAQAEGRIKTFASRNYDTAAISNVLNSESRSLHGSGVGSKVLGYDLGVCKKCTIWWTGAPQNLNQIKTVEDINAQLTLIVDDIQANNKAGRVVINMSFGVTATQVPTQVAIKFYRLLKQLDLMGVVLVAAAGNDGKNVKQINKLPALFASPGLNSAYGAPLTDMIVVGASDQNGHEGDFSQWDSYLTTYAPGKDVRVPYFKPSTPNVVSSYFTTFGTSFSTPMVSGLIGYYRALNSKWKQYLEVPPLAKKLVTNLHRPFGTAGGVDMSSSSVRVIWNAQVLYKNCLLDYDSKSSWDSRKDCPTLQDDLFNQGDGPDPQDCGTSSTAGLRRGLVERQDSGGACAYPGQGTSITFTSSAKPTPTCTAGGCGTLCTGYYCSPHPTGVPPDYPDPKDPSGTNQVPQTTISSSASAPTPTSPNYIEFWSYYHQRGFPADEEYMQMCTYEYITGVPCDDRENGDYSWTTTGYNLSAQVGYHYEGIKFADDTCDYVAKVSSYENVPADTPIGVLNCNKYAQATCYFGKPSTRFQTCTQDQSLAQEIFQCHW